jgi:hypothetical protein
MILDVPEMMRRQDIRIGSWVRILPFDCASTRHLVGYMGLVADIWGCRNDQLMVYIPRHGSTKPFHISRVMLCHSGAKR